MCPAITVLGAGLAYNKDHFKSPPTSWNDLFRKDLKGRPGYPVLSQSYSPLVMTRLAELHGGGIDDIGKGMAKLATIKDRVQLFRIFEILKAIKPGRRLDCADAQHLRPEGSEGAAELRMAEGRRRRKSSTSPASRRRARTRRSPSSF